jgi:hypothetical protein
MIEHVALLAIEMLTPKNIQPAFGRTSGSARFESPMQAQTDHGQCLNFGQLVPGLQTLE